MRGTTSPLQGPETPTQWTSKTRNEVHTAAAELKRIRAAETRVQRRKYDVVPYRDKTKAVRLQIVDAAAYAQLVLENQGRTLSVRDSAVELGRLRAIPLPPRAGEDRV